MTTLTSNLQNQVDTQYTLNAEKREQLEQSQTKIEVKTSKLITKKDTEYYDEPF